MEIERKYLVLHRFPVRWNPIPAPYSRSKAISIPALQYGSDVITIVMNFHL